jgi:hypothetical protein
VARSRRGVRDAFSDREGEEIDDSPQGAPSKRLEALVPRFERPLLGVLAILEISLDRIRAECPHFSEWLSRLESLAHS